MLIRFVVENYLSFKKETEFNMLTGQFKIHKDHIYQIKAKNVDIELLKIASIYGANGSGKSNLIKSIDFLKSAVIKGKLELLAKPQHFRLDDDYEYLPTSFEIEFGFDKQYFAYGLKFQKNKIEEEWLYQLNTKNNTDDELIFQRKTVKEKNKISVNKKYLKSEEDKIRLKIYEEDLTSQTLFFKTAAKRYPEVNNAISWFKNHLTIIYPSSKAAFLVGRCALEDGFREFSNKILSTFSTGIDEIDVETIPLELFLGEEDKDLKERLIEDLVANEERAISLSKANIEVLAILENDRPVIKKLISKHKNSQGKYVDFEIADESDGTQRLLDFIPAIEMVNNEERVVIVDEIDQSIHPALLKTFIKKLLENSYSKGQFLFSTHESNLLDLKLFRQDEIWFTEKDNVGATQLYSLSDYKPRYDLDIRKGYLKGRFGALPFLGNLKDLSWE